MIRRIWAFLILSTSLLGSISAKCDIDPFPPYPPSPPEFRKPLQLSLNDEGILAQWEVLPDQEGYLVSICSGESDYRPIADNVTSQSLLIEQPGVADTYYIQVKAFVKVSGSYVFNAGIIGSVKWNGNKIVKKSTPSSSDSKELENRENTPTKVPADVQRAKLADSETLSSSFPGFNPSQSFYNADYPGVTNPFVPQATPDGRMAPALLTDDGITQTVARVSKKWEGRRQTLRDAKVELVKVVQSNSSSNSKAAKPETQSDSQLSKSPASPPEQIKKLVTPEKSIDKIPIQGAKEQRKTDPSGIPQDRNSDLLIYLFTGFIVLAFIYFIFRKEEK